MWSRTFGLEFPVYPELHAVLSVTHCFPFVYTWSSPVLALFFQARSINGGLPYVRNAYNHLILGGLLRERSLFRSCWSLSKNLAKAHVLPFLESQVSNISTFDSK